MRKPLLLWTACCMALTSYAQQDDSLAIRRIADEILTNSKAYDNLRVLTKTIGGRLAGSPQMVKAEKWGEAALRDAGADKVYTQECMVPHWVRGDKEQARIISNRRDFVPPLNVTALGNSVGTGPKGVTASVIEVKSFDELESRKDEIKGKIVFYNYPFNPRFVKTFNAYGDAVKYRGQGPSRASKYGAVAVIVRSMSHSTDNHPHTGGTHYNDSFPKIAAVAIGLQDAERLSKRIAGDRSAKVFLRTTCEMRPDTIGHNIIGELRGSEFPDEYITVGGHLDSWDNCEGAHDDGAGCVQSIELLRAYKKLGIRPKRTVRVVLFANEENGTRGGRKYAELAKANNEKHLFALESDAGGFTPRGFMFEMETARRDKVKSWASLLLPYGIYDFDEVGGGVDVMPLHRELGIPVSELSPDSQRYFDIHHAASDVFEAVNKRELEMGAVAMSALIYLVDKYGL
ncbi:M20/M25/M40 family metallo-hydrolase [Chitinophaga cymbidii]|nr:M20/M25/M40 family metallo-hydrolase [Chitinophaga cymbidii]